MKKINVKNFRIIILAALFLACTVLNVFSSQAGKIYLPSSVETSEVDQSSILPMSLNKTVNVDIKTPGTIKWYSFTPEESAFYRFHSQGNDKVQYSIYRIKNGKYESVVNLYEYVGNNFDCNQWYNKGFTYYFAVAMQNEGATGSFDISIDTNKKVVEYLDSFVINGIEGEAYMGGIYANVRYDDNTTGIISVADGHHYEYDSYQNCLIVNLQGTDEDDDNFQEQKAGTYKFSIQLYDSANKEVYNSSSSGQDYISFSYLPREEAVKQWQVLAQGKANNINLSENNGFYYRFTPDKTGNYSFSLVKKGECNSEYVGYSRIYSRDEKNGESAYTEFRAYSVEEPDAIMHFKAGTTYYIYMESFADSLLYINYLAEKIDADSIAVKPKATLRYGKTLDLYSTLSYAPANVTGGITWKSSNNKVAKVDRGLVKAVGCGTADITVSVGGKSAVCRIEVPAPKKGSKFVAKKATYRITKAGTKGGTVTFVRTSSTGKSISIPKTVKNSGITYKVTAVGSSALKNNVKVTRLTIGANVKKIGKNAFYGCKRLRSITINSKKLTSKSVGANAFKGTYKKAKIKVPSKKLKAYKKLLPSRGVSKRATIKK